MSRTRRRLQIVTAAAVVAAWAVLYVVVITTAPLSYDPATESAAKVNREFALLLAVPTALWVAAALLLLDRWWWRTGIRMSAMDPPARLLTAAVATLPDHRRQWGMAMTAELAEVGGGRPAGGSRSAAPGPRCGCDHPAAGRCWCWWPGRWRRRLRPPRRRSPRQCLGCGYSR
jgi:hypothetical protein